MPFVWSPHHIYLINLIENIQRNFNKQLPGLYYINYNDKLSFCNLEPLELCRLHNDLIMLYKILHSHLIINMNNCIFVSQTNYTRGNFINLLNLEQNVMLESFFCANRIVDVWNSFNNHVIACTAINSYVKNLKNVYEQLS